ncbi:MAG: hypothetical protein HY040_02475 [Planctomycetes bacterium]|nr:hypothetical protein [Planctomycetota bacterium]
MTYQRILGFAALPALLALMGGCYTVSLNSLVGDKDAVSEPAIVGTWQETDGSGRLVVRATGPAEYEISDPENKNDEPLRMRLIRIHGELLADLSPRKERDSFIAAHVLYRVRVVGDYLHVAEFNSKWLREQITLPGGEAHAVLEGSDGVVLTGSTAELQRVVGRFVNTPLAFEDEASWTRERKQE